MRAVAAWLLALASLTAGCDGQIFTSVSSPAAPPPPPFSASVATSQQLAAALQNTNIEHIYLSGNITISVDQWVSGGTAVIGSGRTVGISKDSAMGPGLASLSFGFIPYLIYLQRGSTLIVENLYMKDAPYASAVYLNNTNNAPYGAYTASGLGPWPSIQTEPNTTLLWTNETSTYYSTEAYSNCSNFQAKVVFALEQLFNDSVVDAQSDLVTLRGNVTLPLPVAYASNGSVAGTSTIYSTDNSIQCIPDPPSAKKASSHTGLKVGLGVGIPLGLLLLAALLFCSSRSRRKRGRKAPPVAVLPVSTKGSDAALATDYTPHTSGNSGHTSYTNGSGPIKLATQEEQPLNGGSGGVSALAEQQQSAGSAAAGMKGGTAGSGPIPALTGSEMQSVARLRMHDTLQGVEVGPLLGKGSGGRVYRGRWNAIPVAVKILDHAVNLQADISRESLLSTSVAHPLVVSTYRVATVRVMDAPMAGEDREKDERITQRRIRRLNSKRKTDTPNGGGVAGGVDGVSVASGVTSDTVTAAQPPSPATAAGGAAPAAAPEIDQRELDRTGSTSSSSGGEQEDEFETWMLLEFCDRGSLHRAIERRRIQARNVSGQMDLLQVLLCLVDIASGMTYLHSVGVLHGDLKSANVLLKSTATDLRGFCCKIADFGLSRVLADEVSHLSTDTYGTVSYMAPELLGQGKFGKPADVYSFGLLMWELLSGEEPYAGFTVARVLYTVVHDKKRPAVPEDCPAEYRAVMESCWHEDPLLRPTFDTVLTQLLPLLDEARAKFKAAGGTNLAPFRAARRPSRDAPDNNGTGG